MKKIYLLIIVALIIVLPIAWYLVSPLFLDKVVSEELPFDTGSSAENDSTQVDSQESVNESVAVEKKGPEVLYSGNFVDADASHKTSGLVRVIENKGERILRLENFKTTNGPDLKVYLSKDLQATDYVSLGELKGNIGDQNYVVSEDIDFEKYSYALIWCEDFRVLFGSALLKNE